MGTAVCKNQNILSVQSTVRCLLITMSPAKLSKSIACQASLWYYHVGRGGLIGIYVLEPGNCFLREVA